LTLAVLPGYRLSLCLGSPGCLRVCAIRWYGSPRKRIDLHTGELRRRPVGHGATRPGAGVGGTGAGRARPDRCEPPAGRV